MYERTSLLLTLYFASGVLSGSLISPCKKSDTPCIEKALNAAIPLILDGVPELGVKTTDPQFIPFVDGNLSTLRYLLFNSTITGFKTCVMSNLSFKNNFENMLFHMNCPELMMTGVYNITGELLSLPLYGNGDFTFVSRDYLLIFNIKLDKVQGSEGKDHLRIQKLNIAAKPLTSATYDFKNLYNGQNDLAATLKKFVKQNWQEVAELVQDPIWDVSAEIMTNTFNSYLERVPLDNFVLN